MRIVYLDNVHCGINPAVKLKVMILQFHYLVKLAFVALCSLRFHAAFQKCGSYLP